MASPPAPATATATAIAPAPAIAAWASRCGSSQRRLPEVTALGLAEQERRVARRQRRRASTTRPARASACAPSAPSARGAEPRGRGDAERPAARSRRAPATTGVAPGEQVVEALGPLEVPHQQRAGSGRTGRARSPAPTTSPTPPRPTPRHGRERGDEQRPGADALGPQVGRSPASPTARGCAVFSVVARRGVVEPAKSADVVSRCSSGFGPQVGVARPARSSGSSIGAVGAEVEHVGPGALLRAPAPCVSLSRDQPGDARSPRRRGRRPRSSASGTRSRRPARARRRRGGRRSCTWPRCWCSASM